MPFVDEYKPGTAIVPQIEAWAKRHSVTLEKPGWKPELAKRVKQQLLADGPKQIESSVLDGWQKLFEAFQGARTKADAPVTA